MCMVTSAVQTKILRGLREGGISGPFGIWYRAKYESIQGLRAGRLVERPHHFCPIVMRFCHLGRKTYHVFVSSSLSAVVESELPAAAGLPMAERSEADRTRNDTNNASNHDGKYP